MKQKEPHGGRRKANASRKYIQQEEKFEKGEELLEKAARNLVHPRKGIRIGDVPLVTVVDSLTQENSVRLFRSEKRGAGGA